MVGRKPRVVQSIRMYRGFKKKKKKRDRNGPAYLRSKRAKAPGSISCTAREKGAKPRRRRAMHILCTCPLVLTRLQNYLLPTASRNVKYFKGSKGLARGLPSSYSYVRLALPPPLSSLGFEISPETESSSIVISQKISISYCWFRGITFFTVETAIVTVFPSKIKPSSNESSRDFFMCYFVDLKYPLDFLRLFY